MALIKCPECDGQVSDHAKVCIHCGYPIEEFLNSNQQENKICIIDGVAHDLSVYKNMLLAIDPGNKELLKKAVRELGYHIGSISIYAAAELAKIIIDTKEIPRTYDGSHLTIKSKKDDGLIHCPRCDSTNVVTGQRGYSMMWGFIGSNRTMNRCAKCGHKWEPRK